MGHFVSVFMRMDPIRKNLFPMCFCIGKVASAKGCEEDLRLLDLNDSLVSNSNCLSGIVDKQLLSGFMGQAHAELVCL